MKNEIPKRVLFILSSMEIGGVQSGIMNFAKITNPQKAQFDIVVLEEKIGFHEKDFLKYGKIYHVKTVKSKNRVLSCLTPFINDLIVKRKMKQLLENNPGYDVVHSKSLLYSAGIAEAAQNANIPIIVTQCHVDKPDKLNFVYQCYYHWCAKRIEKTGAVKLAVSPKAVDLMYGKYGGRVIKNPTISLKRFNPQKFNAPPHDGIKMIQVGTFSHRKNQVFSVKILRELLKRGIKAKLTFVGFSFDEPDYINEINNAVGEFECKDNVTFLPKDSDIPQLLSEHDIMLIPSVREGLPNVALEAQAMGMTCFVSDTVNRQTDCGLVHFLPIDAPSVWADAIIRYANDSGLEKKYIDMSMWDNEKVIEEYIAIWNGQG